MKNTKKLLIVFAGLVCLAFSACRTFRADGLAFYDFGGVEYESLGTFSDSATVHEFLGVSGGPNLFNISSDAMKDKVTAIIWKEVQKKGGNAARNITITYRITPLQTCCNGLTGSIWAPATIVVKGEAIRVNPSVAKIDTDKAIEVAIKNPTIIEE